MTPFEQLDKTVNQYMILADRGIVKLVAALLVASKLEMPRPWVVIVGSSSGGKSMILDALKGIQGIVAIDKLTTKTFISGAKLADGKEASLLRTLPTNAILSIKDLTTIIVMNQETRAEIIGQLRKIYDGDISASFGTGATVKWRGRVGFIAGSTTKIYSVLHEFADLGERFVLYHMKMPNRKTSLEKATRKKAKGATIDDDQAKKDMVVAFKAFYDSIVIPEELPDFDEEARIELIDLCDMACLARSAVERNLYSREKNMEFIHDPEMPFRFMKILMALGYSMQIISGEAKLSDGDKEILYRIALDSIPKNRKSVMNVMTGHAWVQPLKLGVELGLPRDLVLRTLEDLRALELVDAIQDGSRLIWKLKEEYREIIAKFDGITMTNDGLADPTHGSEDSPLPEEPQPNLTTEEQAAVDLFNS